MAANMDQNQSRLAMLQEDREVRQSVGWGLDDAIRCHNAPRLRRRFIISRAS